MASCKITLLLFALLCGAGASDWMIRQELRPINQKEDDFSHSAELVASNQFKTNEAFLWWTTSGLASSVDSDTRPISNSRRHRRRGQRERRQTGTVGGRSQRVTSAPLLQSLSLLDLPVFSRGDRPSSMDKTLGAIFSKVAFSAANVSGSPTGSVVLLAPSSHDNLDTATKIQDSSTGVDLMAAVAATASTTTSTLTSGLATESSTTTTTSTGTPTSSSTSIRSKPVFEFDTRVFDFIPYDRTPAPASDSINRQYNPNVPGLRGPSRINTARHPPAPGSSSTSHNHNNNNNQPFNSRPTIPPLVDLTGRFSTRHQNAPTTTTTTTTTIVTPTTASSDPEEDELEVETTTVAAESTTTTTTTTTSSTVLQTSTPGSTGRGSSSTRDVTSSRGGGSSGQEVVDSRDAAWSIQVYGTSSLFALLGIFALSNLVRLRTSTRRLLSTSHCLSIQLLVLFLAITRSIHLLYDAYNHRRLLPPALAFSIFNVAFPCLSSALAVLLLGIFKATKLQVMPSALVKPALWAALVAFHFALSLSIDIVVGSVGGLFSLHLASQAYFVLWSLALSLGYLAAFAPATRAAISLQTETVRSHLTALHVHGASLPRYLPQPTLLRAVRVTLAAAILALLVAAFQLYGMFGVYGLPWRQQPMSSSSMSSSHHLGSVSHGSGTIPVVLTAEFLARYQGLQRDRNLNVDALREVLGLTSSSIDQPATASEKQPDYWPVANENFWPWWTYQLIARLLEFIMAALIAYVAVQPWRYNQTTLAEKQGDVSGGTGGSSSANGKKTSSLWMFAGRSFKNGSIETLSTLCCQTNRAAGAMGRNGAGETVVGNGGGAMTDLSPVKSVASDSDSAGYPPANMRNYCYSNPTSSHQHHMHHLHHQVQQQQQMTDGRSMTMGSSNPIHSATSSASSSTAFSALYDTSKRSQQQQQHNTHSSRPRCAINMSHQPVSSVLVNDSGFIRFRDGIATDSADDQMEQPYEEVDRQRGGATAGDPHHSHQHIYQELGYKAPSLTYYSTASSVTSSSNTTHKGTATTPSVCTYEHLCRRGLAGYYEPQLYEMQLPNNAQLLSLLAKESCQMFQPCNIYGGSLAGQHPPSMPGQHLRHHCQHCNCCSGSSHMCASGVDSTDSPVASPCGGGGGQKSSNYESYGPKPEGQSPAVAVTQSEVLQNAGIRTEDYVYGMLLAVHQPQDQSAGQDETGPPINLELSFHLESKGGQDNQNVPCPTHRRINDDIFTHQQHVTKPASGRYQSVNLVDSQPPIRPSSSVRQPLTATGQSAQSETSVINSRIGRHLVANSIRKQHSIAPSRTQTSTAADLKSDQTTCDGRLDRNSSSARPDGSLSMSAIQKVSQTLGSLPGRLLDQLSNSPDGNNSDLHRQTSLHSSLYSPLLATEADQTNPAPDSRHGNLWFEFSSRINWVHSRTDGISANSDRRLVYRPVGQPNLGNMLQHESEIPLKPNSDEDIVDERRASSPDSLIEEVDAQSKREELTRFSRIQNWNWLSEVESAL